MSKSPLSLLFKALPFFLLGVSTLQSADTAAAVAKARALIDKGDLTGSLAVLDSVKAQAGRDSSALYLRGYVLFRMRRITEAREQLSAVVKQAPPALSPFQAGADSLFLIPLLSNLPSPSQCFREERNALVSFSPG